MITVGERLSQFCIALPYVEVITALPNVSSLPHFKCIESSGYYLWLLLLSAHMSISQESVNGSIWSW